jgi:hypothetical protein
MIRGPVCSSGPGRGKSPVPGNIEYRDYITATVRSQFDNKLGIGHQVCAGGAGIREVPAWFSRRPIEPTTKSASEAIAPMSPYRALNRKVQGPDPEPVTYFSWIPVLAALKAV